MSPFVFKKKMYGDTHITLTSQIFIMESCDFPIDHRSIKLPSTLTTDEFNRCLEYPLFINFILSALINRRERCILIESFVSGDQLYNQVFADMGIHIDSERLRCLMEKSCETYGRIVKP